MFGRLREKRAKKAEDERIKSESAAERKEIEKIGLPAEEDVQELKSRQQELTEQQRGVDDQRRTENRQDIESSINRDFEGLSEEKKGALQQTANRQISQQTQRANRQMQSEAGSRGFVGGDDALKMETARLATDAQGQFSRDLAVMDSDAALQKIGTALAMEEGRAAQDLLQDQGFMDQLLAMMEKQKEDKWTSYTAAYGN